MGMIGDVYYGKADLAIGNLGMNHQRNQLVDFSMPYHIDPVTFISRNSHINSEYRLLNFFAQNDWFSYFVITAIFFSTISTVLFKLASDQKSQKWISSLMKILSIIFEALLPKPHTNSNIKKFEYHEKVFSIFWRIFGMIFMVIYSTFILTWLIINVKPIESIEELRVAVNDERVRVWYHNRGTALGQLLRARMKKLNNFIIILF
jgi:hypothetical protein